MSSVNVTNNTFAMVFFILINEVNNYFKRRDKIFVRLRSLVGMLNPPIKLEPVCGERIAIVLFTSFFGD